jgi:competence protein ComEA
MARMSKAEQRALIVLTAVVVLGVGTRSWRTYCGAPSSSAQSPQASADLDRQIQTVDSVRVETGRQPGVAPLRPAGSPASPGSSGRGGRATGRGSRGRSRSKPEPTEEAPVAPMPRGKLDLDSATAEQIQATLGIGPVLAKRIVADRTEHGKFGCLAELRTVQGVGPAVMRRIDSLVTFSGLPRPTGNRCGD